MVLSPFMSELHGDRRLQGPGRGFLCTILLTLVMLLTFTADLSAINAPTITHVAGKAVVPDSIMYSNTSSFQIRGNAQFGTEIRLLRNNKQVATSTTSVDGTWTVNFASHPTGSFQYAGVAYNAPFISEPSPSVEVMVDTTGPSISLTYGRSGCRSNAKYQCLNIGYITATVSDALAGIDFSSAWIEVDYAVMPTTGDPDDFTVTNWINVPGRIEDNGSNMVNFYPSAGFGIINQNFRKVRLRAGISDLAGNNTLATPKEFYNQSNSYVPAPIIESVYDPDHSVFTGTGEPTSNTPDAGGWVKYYPHMTISTNPPKLRGRVEKWSPIGKGWETWYIGDNTYTRWALDIIDQTNGQFILTYPGIVLPFGPTTLDVRAKAHDCHGRRPFYVYLVTQKGTPKPIRSLDPYSGEQQILGSRLWPDFYGRLYKMPFEQVVQIGWGDHYNTTWKPQLSQVVLPEGQSTLGTAGKYDPGDVWYDANDNGQWDTGEPFYDMPSIVSDGESFELVNFTDQIYNRNGLSTLGILVRNEHGKSTASRVVCAHHNESYPPTLNELTVFPLHSSNFRNDEHRPELIRIAAQNWGYAWSGFHLLNYSDSTAYLSNGQGSITPIPDFAWTHLGNLAFQGNFNISNLNLPDGTYKIHARIENKFNLVREDDQHWFKIDNVPPAATEMIPADGQPSNTFTSFSARIIDPNLADGSPGSGADIDVANPQLIPFKLLTIPSTISDTSQPSWEFTLAGGESVAIDHKGDALAKGTEVELWVTFGGKYEPKTYVGTIASNGSGKLRVNLPPDCVQGSAYVVMYPIPFFTSNNGVDRVGAVPIAQITADGTYVTKVYTRDRAGNKGTFYTTSSPLEVPVSTIDYNFDKPFLFAGLYPSDVGTFTTSAVTTRSGNNVLDGQPLSLIQMPSTLTKLVPPDANGIPGDGHQTLFGENGAPKGSGRAAFGVEVITDNEGAVSIYGVIGLAKGTSDPVHIYRIDPFTISPQSPVVEITPANPTPSVNIVSSFVGKLSRATPDGTVATFTTNFGWLSPDARPDLTGIQGITSNGLTSVSINTDTMGTANIQMQLGGRNASTQVQFVDRYPPPAPTSITSTPQYSNTGSFEISWNESIDLGGAGTTEYRIEQSSNGGPWVQVATVSAISATVFGLADGSYRFRVRAIDSVGNISGYSPISESVIVDRVAPPAVPCTDLGPGNNDPDEHFSTDSNVYFYFNPTDDRSGPGEVQIQISHTPDTSQLVTEPWFTAADYYLFQDGLPFKDYYARVRVKDRAGNIGGWGSWSNGIHIAVSGAVTPPNAPTITHVHGKNAVPGVPVQINLGNSVSVEGLSEANTLIMIYVNNTYLYSVISDADGNFNLPVDLSAGTSSIKVKADNGLAESSFSNTITVNVDLNKPFMNLVIYDTADDVRTQHYINLNHSNALGTFDFFLSDTGGSGFDISTANATLTDIDNDGTALPPIAPYSNPLSTSMVVIAADRVRMHSATAWKTCLRNGHRYRVDYSIKDRAGNLYTNSFQFAIDNTMPGLADGVPANTVPPNCNIKTLYIYDHEKYPSGHLPAEALVPFKWSAAQDAFAIDPDFNDVTLVDKSESPPALMFNTPGVYGTLHKWDHTLPALQKGRDTFTSSVIIGGYSSGITSAGSFRFGFRTMTNGADRQTLVVQDHAINRDSYYLILNIKSPNAAPKPPSSVEFINAADPSMTYQLWTNRDHLFPEHGGIIRDREVLITDNSNGLIVKVTVPEESFAQHVQILHKNGSILDTADVAHENTTAIMTIDQPGNTGTLEFRIRTFANGYYSTYMPRPSTDDYYYYWVKGDTTPATTFDIFPTESFFNTLSGPDARPFPSQFSVSARDTADGSTVSFLEVAATSVRVVNAGGTVVPGSLTRDYVTSGMTYGFRYNLSSPPTTEGTYYYELSLPDAARPNSNPYSVVYPFKLDTTPPFAASVNPGDGEVTNSLPSFNAEITDPNLADGSSGSGPNMDPSRRQIHPFKSLGSGPAGSTTTITTSVLGVDTSATDHVDNVLALDTEVWFSRLVSGSLQFPVTKGRITTNSGNVISATVTSGPNLVTGQQYTIVYEIPNFPGTDGISRVAAVPIQPAIKGGAYIVFLKLIDNALNQGTYSSSSSIYEAAYGAFSLTPNRTRLYTGLYPPHTANFVSSPILTTEGNPIKEGTEVTLLTNSGSFTPADSNGIPGDGHQVEADSSGVLNFGLQATELFTGYANVRAIIGLASGTNTSVELIQIPAFSLNVTSQELVITPANPNPSTSLNTSAIGYSNDLIPNGTCINVFNDLGTISPADAYPAIVGHQIQTTSGRSTFTISSTDAGVASITVEAGGRRVIKQITFIDRHPPTAPGTPSLDNRLNNNGAFNLMWVPSTDPGNSGIDSYSIEYSTNSGPYVFLATSAVPRFQVTGLPQGEYRFRVRAIDGAGNIGNYSPVSVSAEVDITPPVGSIIINSNQERTASYDVTLTLSATDDNGVADMSFSNDGTNWSGWVTYSNTRPWTLSVGDGSKVVYVRYRDTVGNMGIFSDTITLDTTGPLGGVSINPSPWSPTNNLELTLFASDGSGVPHMALSLNGSAFSWQDNSLSYAWNVAPGFATHTVRVKYRDSLGNESAIYTAVTCVDTILPTTPVVEDDGEYSKFIDKLRANWSSSDGQSGISHYLVQIGTSPGAANVVAQTNVGNVSEYIFSDLNLDLTGITQYYFTVYAVNVAGGVSAPGYSDGVKGGDPTPPEPFFVSDEGDFTRDKTKLSATWTASKDPDSGINRYEFSIGTAKDLTNVLGWTDVGLNLSYVASGLNLSHGQIYYINVTAYNNGGTYTPAYSDGIRVDIKPLPVPKMNVEPAFSPGTSNTVNCSVVVDDFSGGVQYDFQRATNAAFTSHLQSSGWLNLNSHTFSALTHGVTYYFRVRTRDAIGNVSAYSSHVFSTQDSNPPTATAYTDNIAANNDPDHVWSRNCTVHFAAAGLTDDLSGVKDVYVQISNSSNFSYILAESWLNNTSGARTYVAPNIDGSTIYARAQFEDVAGNISKWYKTDGIRLDLSRPIAGATTDHTAENNDPNHYVSTDPNIYFDFTHSDAISGVADVFLQISRDAAFADLVKQEWLGAPATSYQFTGGEDGYTYYARIRVIDRAGWESTGFGEPSDGIRVDMSPPDPLVQAFYINKKPGENIGDSTTSTSTVYISITLQDPSGIAYAYISNTNNGTDWVIWPNPAYPAGSQYWHPASMAWQLQNTPGVKTVYMEFEDGVGNRNWGAAAVQSIGYYPSFGLKIGTKDEGIYPINTYDEYPGQNKYGIDRSKSRDADKGSSLKLIKP